MDTSPSLDDTQPIRRAAQRRRIWLPLFLVMLTVSVLLLCMAGVGLMLTFASATRVILVIGGQEYPLYTQARTVDELLRDVGITLEATDHVSPAPQTPLQPDMRVEIESARDVLLTVDGRMMILRTTQHNPADILNEAGVNIGTLDRIIVDGTTVEQAQLAAYPVPVRRIEIRRAVTITVSDGGVSSTLQTAELTVGEALFAAGIVVYLADSVTPDLNAPVSDGLSVTIERAVPVTVIADGVTLDTRTHGAVVADALQNVGVLLSGLDYSIPAENTALQPGITVRVIRVTEEVITEQQTIPYDTIYQPDAALELDQRQIVQAGQIGVRQTTTRIRYENSTEVNRSVDVEAVLRDPLNAIIAYGTNIVLRTLDTPQGTLEYWRVLRMYATSYHPAALGGDNITATGRLLQHGVVGVPTSIIPYGTQIYVEGYGVGIASDTGAARSSLYWIDLGYSDEDYVGWAEYVDVYILAPVPAEVNYLLPEWTPLRGTSDG
jgi:uncharacterized protein YabE (DUF348 family)